MDKVDYTVERLKKVMKDYPAYLMIASDANNNTFAFVEKFDEDAELNENLQNQFMIMLQDNPVLRDWLRGILKFLDETDEIVSRN